MFISIPYGNKITLKAPCMNTLGFRLCTQSCNGHLNVTTILHGLSILIHGVISFSDETSYYILSTVFKQGIFFFLSLQ